MLSPKMPKWTCPLIDDVISTVGRAVKVIDEVDLTDSDDCHDMRVVALAELNGLDAQMEDIRTANSQLRACAEYWEEQCNNLQAEVDALVEKLDVVSSECQDLRSELNEYTST